MRTRNCVSEEAFDVKPFSPKRSMSPAYKITQSDAGSGSLPKPNLMADDKGDDPASSCAPSFPRKSLGDQADVTVDPTVEFS